MTIHGIPKPAYRAYELLHRLGKELLVVEGAHPTVDVWMVKGPSVLHILVTNSVLPRHPVKTEAVRILLDNSLTIKGAFVERIDDSHANATVAWEAMGKPGYLNSDQVAQLEMVSSLTREVLAVTTDNGAVRLDIEIPPQGTALITLETA